MATLTIAVDVTIAWFLHFWVLTYWVRVVSLIFRVFFNDGFIDVVSELSIDSSVVLKRIIWILVLHRTSINWPAKIDRKSSSAYDFTLKFFFDKFNLVFSWIDLLIEPLVLIKNLSYLHAQIIIHIWLITIQILLESFQTFANYFFIDLFNAPQILFHDLDLPLRALIRNVFFYLVYVFIKLFHFLHISF